MILHFFVEGPSERAFVEAWASRFARGHVIRVHPHQGKGQLPRDLSARPNPLRRGMLDQLPAKLRAFSASPPSQAEGFLVLVDADDDDCVELKAKLDNAASHCAPDLQVVNRIAIEELEAFYLGDLRAIRSAFPQANTALLRRHVPDSVVEGGTWELFARVIDDDSRDKVAWAEAMGRRLTVRPAQSRSPSFQALCRGIQRLVGRPSTHPRGPARAPRERTEAGRRRR